MQAGRASHDRPQTIKQAKQAFKTRGSTSVSAEERRRLERGALLLERANRIKEQEQRKKDLLRRKGESKDSLQQEHILLGTQRRLDKFGYKSSQLHLGAFLKTKRSSPVSEQLATTAAEPWDDEHLDDETLFELTDDEYESLPQNQSAERSTLLSSSLGTAARDGGETASPTHADQHQWDDFLASSSQLARELSNETKKATAFSSFGSMDFSSEDIEALDPSYDDTTPSALSLNERPIPRFVSGRVIGSASMGPPPRPPTSLEATNTTARLNSKNAPRQYESSRLMPPPAFPAARAKSEPMNAARALTDQYGISFADLEYLADEDVDLTGD